MGWKVFYKGKNRGYRSYTYCETPVDVYDDINSLEKYKNLIFDGVEQIG